MKTLVFASAAHTVVKRAIAEFRDESGELFVWIPSSGYDAYSDLFDAENIHCVRLGADRFHNLAESDLELIKSVRFDTAVIVSGGLGFIGYYNVIDVVSKLSARRLIFYNAEGQQSVYDPPKGIGRFIDKHYALLMMKIFLGLNKIELLFERVFA